MTRRGFEPGTLCPGEQGSSFSKASYFWPCHLHHSVAHGSLCPKLHHDASTRIHASGHLRWPHGRWRRGGVMTRSPLTHQLWITIRHSNN